LKRMALETLQTQGREYAAFVGPGVDPDPTLVHMNSRGPTVTVDDDLFETPCVFQEAGADPHQVGGVLRIQGHAGSSARMDKEISADRDARLEFVEKTPMAVRQQVAQVRGQ